MQHRSGPVPQISSSTYQSTNSPSTASPCHSHSLHCSLERFSHACRHACLRSFPAFNASFKCNHRRRGPSSLGAALGPTPRSFNKSLAGPIASPTLDFLCGLPFLAFGFLCEWLRNLPFSETRCRKRCVRQKTRGRRRKRKRRRRVTALGHQVEVPTPRRVLSLKEKGGKPHYSGSAAVIDQHSSRAGRLHLHTVSLSAPICNASCAQPRSFIWGQR